MKNMVALLIMSWCLYACGGSNNAQTENNAPLVFEEKQDGFDDLRTAATTQLALSTAPAVSIGIYKEGEIVFAEAYGKKVADEDENVDKDTLFQMGSTTKMFTALATLRQVERGFLARDEKLLDALPTIQVRDEHRSAWEKINLHHLMTHQSGLFEYYQWDPIIDNVDEFLNIDYPKNYPPMNPAGRFWNYNNTNWSYLGAILEHQLDESFPNIIEDHAFLPLDMPRSTVKKSDVLQDGNYALGSGFIRTQEGLLEGSAKILDDIDQQSTDIAAGSYTWSTPTEMLKMADFLLRGDSNILADELREQMIQPLVDTKSVIPIHYGYGLYLHDGFNQRENWYPLNILEHSGVTFAYSSLFWVLPEHNVAIVVLSSSRGNDGRDFFPVMTAAVRSVITLPESQSIPLTPTADELFQQHTGRYVSQSGVYDAILQDGVLTDITGRTNRPLVIDVSLADDTLMLDIPAYNQDGITYTKALEPLGGSVFRAIIDDDPYDLTFLPDAEGEESVYIRYRSFVAVRE